MKKKVSGWHPQVKIPFILASGKGLLWGFVHTDVYGVRFIKILARMVSDINRAVMTAPVTE